MKIEYKIKYCTECVIPNTRPEIHFDKNGVCSACNNAKLKKKVNWKKRKQEFLKILLKHKKSNINNDYNCIVPVSGGKDSIYQLYLLKKNLK
jgi:hypothetical protein